jgi:hypothetical protein
MFRALSSGSSNRIKSQKKNKKTDKNASHQSPHSAENLKQMNSGSPNSRSNCSSSNELNIHLFSLLILCLSLYFTQKITVLNEIRKSQAAIKTGASNHKIKNTHTQKQTKEYNHKKQKNTQSQT